MLERLLVTTRVITRADDRAGAYRVRNVPTLPSLGPASGPRLRTRPAVGGSWAGPGTIGPVATPPVMNRERDRQDLSGESNPQSPMSADFARTAAAEETQEHALRGATLSPARVETVPGARPEVALGWLRRRGLRGWNWPWTRAVRAQGPAQQMELPLRGREVLVEVRVVRNDLRDADEEVWGRGAKAGAAGNAGPRAWLTGLRALQRWFDGWVERLAGSRQG